MLDFDRITTNPDILGGKACIRGMRISVSSIVNLVANGMTPAEIMDEYPDLEPEDIRQALQYSNIAIAPSLRRGMLKPDGASPTDQELLDGYMDYLIEKYGP